MLFAKQKKDSGVALLIVTLMVILLSMLVMQISHSTFLHGRSIGQMERSVQAEYLLKSALNIGVAMIEQDTTPNYDSFAEDIWGRFSSGFPIPEEMLQQIGVNFPGMEIAIEIRPEEAKINIATSELRQSGSGSSDSVIALAQYFTKQLFQNLGFDQGDLYDTVNLVGPARRPFNSMELTSNLIDFYDDNSESFSTTETMPDNEILPDGIEDSLPENYFPEKGKKIGNFDIRELLLVPGMTPLRLRTLMPFARTRGQFAININVAPLEVLKSISPEIDDTLAQSIIEYRNENGAFKNVNELNDLGTITNTNALTVNSSNFDFIAKVRFGDTKPSFIKARINHESQSSPARITSITMY